MYENKEDTNILLVLFTSIIYVFIAIFVIFFIGLSKVDAQSYYFSNPSLHRICSNTTINNSSTNCETNNYQNWVGSPSGIKGNFLQVAYRMNTNNNGVGGTTYLPGNYSVSFQGVLQTIPGTDLSTSNIKLDLIYYPTGSNEYGKATCDNDETFRVTKTPDEEGNFYFYSYSCETLTITEGKSFVGYEIYISPTSLVKYIQWNQMATNLSLIGQGDATNGDIINNQNQNTQDIINNQNQNTQDVIDSVTNPDISGSNNTIGGFFGSFSDTDHGGLSGIITAPLIAFNQMLTGTCTDLSVEYKGSTTTLPCGTSFWNQISPIRDFLNITLGGLICYQIVRKLFLLIQKIKNPDDDRVEVMSL